MSESEPPRVRLSDADETRRFATRLGSLLAPGDLVLVEGELGVGKTFFARALAYALEVPRTIPITSPTFALVHEYAGRVPVLHADFYRLQHPAEAEELGLLERDDAVRVVEWGAKWLTVRCTEWLCVGFVFGELEDARVVCLDARGNRGRYLVEQLVVWPVAALP